VAGRIADNRGMTCRITTDAAEAADVLRAGGLVALPTETVYGLGADANNSTAVARVFDAKQRPAFDPLIVHLSSLSQWMTVATDLPPQAALLAERFWPGPLTLVLPKQPHISDLVTAGLPTVAVRVPRHPLMHAVLEQARCPIAAPSANRFGRLSPTRPEHVRDQLGDAIDLILDGGPCPVGVESTIVRPDADGATILRLGGLPLEEIETIAGPVRMASTESPTAPEAPGMLPQHYAPQTPVELAAVASTPPAEVRWGLLTLSPIEMSGYEAVEVLSVEGDLVEAAAQFFAALHRLDSLGLDRIVAVPLPEQGLGRAMNDRLRRAAATT
jgi:L-threonylcarbamoyladenylate synthase